MCIRRRGRGRGRQGGGRARRVHAVVFVPRPASLARPRAQLAGEAQRRAVVACVARIVRECSRFHNTSRSTHKWCGSAGPLQSFSEQEKHRKGVWRKKAPRLSDFGILKSKAPGFWRKSQEPGCGRLHVRACSCPCMSSPQRRSPDLPARTHPKLDRVPALCRKPGENMRNRSSTLAAQVYLSTCTKQLCGFGWFRENAPLPPSVPPSPPPS